MNGLSFVRLVIVAAAMPGLQVLAGGMAQAQTSSPQSIPSTDNADRLKERDFWALIDHSATLGADPDAQLADLRAGLDRLPANRIADFERIFDATMRRSYSWDLWGAAFVASGGVSDDGFEYFRCWLISRGRKTFEAVLADPDKLADIIPPGLSGDVSFEEFAYAAREAWAAKTGQDWNNMPVIAAMAYDTKPSGVQFSEEPADLARRYPKLWARFGSE
ncbi:MAG: DUF4240 domain-containing protein [Novosphingobium sp.]|jgi:hypothetical protein|uniref:DUF4240 domain-containing protein n=1 Tax=Novosphingobium sp. TaxID=1874826 RepID=UPI003016AD30